MQLTRRGEYAMRAMYDLAMHEEDGITYSREIAKRQQIPPKYIAQIILDLSRSGLVHTNRGAHGGVRLAKSSDDISLKDIVEAIEGPISLNICLLREGGCEKEDDCPIHEVWVKIQGDMLRTLASTTLTALKSSHDKKKRFLETIID
ncbi:MAG: Rrf2 family transcriptional regulator [Actinobacteria bacterium]|nr:Rrf2 family transcriptional regulator [Actinomycetota bacterium]